MTKEKSQERKLDLPSEVLRVIGMENLSKLSTPAYNSALGTLSDMYHQKGLDWIKENKTFLIDDLKSLEMF